MDGVELCRLIWSPKTVPVGHGHLSSLCGPNEIIVNTPYLKKKEKSSKLFLVTKNDNLWFMASMNSYT